MSSHRSTTGIKLILTFIALVGFGLNLFIVLDAGSGVFGILKPPALRSDAGEATPPHVAAPKELAAFVEQAQKSILLIKSSLCTDESRGSLGTGFVVKSNYVVTNAHVVAGAVGCGNPILGRDYRGKEHKLHVVGIQAQDAPINDIAILSMEDGDASLPALSLADSEAFTNGHAGDKIFTLGYGTIEGASVPSSPAMSGIGNISQYNAATGMFVTENMSLKHGNSGGPLLLEADRKVLGVVFIRFNELSAAATSMIIPINQVKRFFREKTGTNL
jgi:putative serine protease PepD